MQGALGLGLAFGTVALGVHGVRLLGELLAGAQGLLRGHDMQGGTTCTGGGAARAGGTCTPTVWARWACSTASRMRHCSSPLPGPLLLPPAPPSRTLPNAPLSLCAL